MDAHNITDTLNSIFLFALPFLFVCLFVLFVCLLKRIKSILNTFSFIYWNSSFSLQLQTSIDQIIFSCTTLLLEIFFLLLFTKTANNVQNAKPFV
eukprot:m.236017 g.236017  ORF g.236017 m.236017 type:complete len:95 (+) comp13918_c1_seq4:2297-2581(+)